MYMGRLTWGHTSVAVPAIVSVEEWEAMQRLQATNRARHHPRRVASPYLLSGVAICGLCGRPLRGQVRHTVRDYRYYMCSHAGEPRCPLPGIRCVALDMAVIAWLMANVLSDEAIATYREQLADTSSGARQLAEARVAQAERQRTECESAITNLVRAIEAAPNNSHLVARLEDRTRETERLRSEAAAARVGLNVGNAQPADVAKLRAALEAGFRGEQVPEARGVVAMLLESVTVYSREECLITWRSWPFVPTVALSPHKVTVGITSPTDGRRSNGRSHNVRRPPPE